MKGRILLLMLLLIGAASPWAQEFEQGYLPPDALVRPDTALSALLGLEVDRQLVEAELVKTLRRVADWRNERDQTLQQLQDLYAEVDVAVVGGGASPQLERQVLMEEAQLQILGAEGRSLRAQIAAAQDRMIALQEKAGELAALIPPDTDSLTGVWDVRLIPTGETGVFTLYQTGTILNGEYVLGGGWHGSLDGTVVEGRVYLQRIDSVKGRFADLSGDVDGTGRTVRGKWNERDLTSNRPVEGSWIARKRLHPRPSGR